MWAFRSLRRRLSSRSHASLLPAVLGSGNQIGSPRRYASNNSNVDSHAMESNRHHLAVNKPHLYVVLDDHKDGHGIYMLDMDHNDDDHLGGGGSRPLQLGPPILRVAFPTVGDSVQFTAVGSSIVAIATGLGIQPDQDALFCSAFMYDTETSAMVVSAQVPEGLFLGYDAAIAVGQRLYMLESKEPEFEHVCSGAFPGGLHCLAADGGGDKNLWSWQRSLSPSSRWCWISWSDGLMFPFCPTTITGHAVHAPPGSPHHHIFVSAAYGGFRPSPGGTFSFSSGTGKWTRRSEFYIPVVGHAHYDGELDTWVGLSSDGHLCTFNVGDPELGWEVGSEKLFRLDDDITAGWRHVDAKLVSMSQCHGRNKYCLMERLRPEGEVKECLGEGHKCLLRLTSFCLERDKDGRPVTIARQPARSYKISRYNVEFDAQAFWM